MNTFTNVHGVRSVYGSGGNAFSRACLVALSFSVALALLFFLCSCATDTPDLAKNARGAATNQALREAEKILGSIGTSYLYSIAKSEATDQKVDFQQSGTAALWANIDLATTVSAARNIYNAYSAAKTPKTTQAVGDLFTSATAGGQDQQKAVNAIATVISTATGAPPAI